MDSSASADAPRHCNPRHGFTIIELLVVITLVTVLVSMLLPLANRAREQTRILSCLNNLKLIGQATICYNIDNNGQYPLPAVNAMPEDWVYWQNGRSLNTGGVVRYMGTANPAQILCCPSDDPQTHSGWPNSEYPFSYSMNINVSGYYPWGEPPTNPCWSSPPLYLFNRGQRQIKHPGNCIIYIDESEQTLDDGCWAWQPNYGSGQNVITARHDQYDRELRNDPSNPTAGHGNVAFCDGHAASILRADAYNPVYYDPTK